MKKFKSILDWIRTQSTAKRIIFVAVVAAITWLLVGCTSTRSMAVSVDKAEKVEIHLTDSLQGTLPFLP